MSNAPDLLPCPFCGGEAVYTEGWGVRCSDCYCGVPARLCEVDEQWNRRADLALAARVKPLDWDHVDYARWSTGRGHMRPEYTVKQRDCGFEVLIGSGNFKEVVATGKPNLEEAKAAAQADYARRTTSALEPSPTPHYPSLPTLAEAARVILDERGPSTTRGPKHRAVWQGA